MGGSGIATIVTTVPDTLTGRSLIDVMLEVARLMGVVHEGAATGGSTTTLIDTNMSDPAGYFTNGTLWILSGSYDGTCNVVSTHNEGTLAWATALAGAIISGVEYAVATPEYPKHKIKQAVLSSLRLASVLKTVDTLVVVTNTGEYTLPTGVSNIKRVEIAGSASTPYGFSPNFYWKEWNGKLVFDDGNYPTDTGRIIRIWYLADHGDISETGTVSSAIDLNWLRWASAAFLFRDQIKTIQKDNPTAVDLLNEARTNEAEARREAKRYQLTHMSSDPKLAGW